ncbi:hypothetical protein KC332_g11432 [Hortaea werneckii]|uniref:F-box domain-containing protein n=1 Tax=Hortaea werneckii EXF-2000 TaxID=1157616 RepID=A0A1Z5TVA3_HORWE|nr:hypothetical protein KC358_g13619 [Hortaea werneckii]OTA39923.1 hypothetical protein BTJ68_00034 [Hortaea werneckii EXF-2000]KAI6808573.1 hypothetical protein KC350_g13271 [Hortaea werneckii]KAI6909730.1 hypothetical protein KC348_g13411 [Hortaea werneckii]KAI6928916.1 hypothetical protein KC341_g11196 [Hortaea werneckii]
MGDANQQVAEAELEAFRQRWREEVQSRNRPAQTHPSHSSQSQPERREQRKTHHVAQQSSVVAPGPSSSTRRREVTDYSEEVEPKTYHDLPDKEEQLRLGTEGQNRDRRLAQEPTSALEHYERAVEKETQGHLGDSIQHYRRAFKLDDGVHEAYKQKHFPPSSFPKPKPTNPNPSNASATVPNPAHHSLHGSTSALPATLKELVQDFSSLSIEAPPPATDASPPERSLLGELPEEILSQIMMDLAIEDVASFARLAPVCKRLAYLVLTEDAVWKRVALGNEYGFAAMVYDFQCDIEGTPLEANDQIAQYLASEDELTVDEYDEFSATVTTPEHQASAFTALTEHLLHTQYSSSWRQLFRSRPRVRFNGCYISTVNYARAGGTSTNTLTWGAPVHVVTYFRYLRFFRDGTAISLLTTTEPADVVHHLTKENLHDHHGNNLPSSVMRDALRGRWRLSGPAATPYKDPAMLNAHAQEAETEGDVHIETEGVVPKYYYRMQLAMSHAGKGARNNKLAWKGFWSYNRLTDDWGEFGLKNDRAFYWSRVRSYGTGL